MFLHMCACLCPCECRPETSGSYCSPGLTLFFCDKVSHGDLGLTNMLDCMESSDLLVITFTFVLESNSGSHVYAAAFYQLSHLMVSQLYLWKDDCFNHKHTSICSWLLSSPAQQNYCRGKSFDCTG